MWAFGSILVRVNIRASKGNLVKCGETCAVGIPSRHCVDAVTQHVGAKEIGGGYGVSNIIVRSDWSDLLGLPARQGR